MPQFERRLACKSWLHSFITHSYTFFLCCCRCYCCVVTWLFVNDPLLFKWQYKKAQKTFIRCSNTQSLKSLDRHRHFYIRKSLERVCTHTHTKRLRSVYLSLAHSNFRLLLACLFVPFCLPSVFLFLFIFHLCFPLRRLLLLILWTFILAFSIAIALLERTLEFSPSFHAHVQEHILCS